MHIYKKYLVIILMTVTFLAALYVRFHHPEELIEAECRREALGTFAMYKVIAETPESAEAIFDSVSILIDSLEKTVSRFSDGELAFINSEGEGKTGEELLYLLELSQELYYLTGYAFDPTIAPLMDQWGFPHSPEIPDSSTIDSLLKNHTGWENILLTENYVVLEEGSAIDLGGIAKGYIVDRAYELAMELGAAAALIEIGGEIRCGSKASIDRIWRIGISHPRESGLWQVIEISEGAVATSGDYECFFIKDDIRYCHLIDPLTGWPEQGTVSATVISHRADIADGLATAIAVRGSELVDQLPDSLYSTIFVLSENDCGEIIEQKFGK